MPPIKNLIGKKFGRWTVVRPDKIVRNRMQWVCKCICGKERSIDGSKLPRYKHTQKCYCSINEKHGLKGTRAYNSWAHMIQRCTNPFNKDFPHYGGRGILVCEKWKIFTNFYADMGQPPDPRHSLGRINNERGYEPDNVRWEDTESQRRNTRRNFIVTHNGKTQCIVEWARDLGVDRKMLSCCIRYGMPIKIALNPKTWPLARGRSHINSKPPK